MKKTTQNVAVQTLDLTADAATETVFDTTAKLNDEIEKYYYKKISMPVMNKSFIMIILTLIMMTNIQYMLIYIVFRISCHVIISSMSCFDNRLKKIIKIYLIKANIQPH